MAAPADPLPVHRLSYLGHATARIDLGPTAVVTDPILRSRVMFLRWTAGPQRMRLVDDATAVLISHLHYDHADLPSLALLGRDRLLVVPAGSAQFFQRHGFTRVVPLRPGQSHHVDGLTVTATEATHDGRRHPVGPRRTALGYLVAGSGARVYFAGDTDLFAGMRDIRPEVDVALLPVAGWGPRLGPGHLDPVRAAEAAARLEPRISVPIHWCGLRAGWWRPGDDVSLAAPAAFAAEVERRGVRTHVRVLQPGQSLTF
jgi:L-ascorbate metabolism protein UlaG (beta-lactamase superfamily)